MAGSREGFGYDKPLWKQRRGHLLQFLDHKATEKENLSKNLRKTNEKERAKNQAVTTRGKRVATSVSPGRRLVERR